MDDELRPYAFTTEAATAAAALFAFRAEFEGYWEAICVCGQCCGMTLLPPTNDDTNYVTCPECHRSGRDGGVKWIRVD